MAAAVATRTFDDWSQNLHASPFSHPGIRTSSNSDETSASYQRHPIEAADREPTYHEFEDAEYVLPNDFQEHLRLEIQAAHLSEMMHNRVLHAPVSSSAERVLDIGCGTGIVTDLMSERYPQAECIGLDLSVVPKIRAHRPNVRFFQGNAAVDRPSTWLPNDRISPTLPRDAELFDHIFSRLLILGMTDWPSFLRTSFNLLKPGGYTEVQDLAWHWYNSDGSIASKDWKWLQLLNQNLSTKGMDTLCGLKAEQWMREVGFEDVKVTKYVMPFCGMTEKTKKGREYGKFNVESVPDMLHHAIERAVGEGEEGLVEEMRREMRECLMGGKGLYQVFYVTVGRRPE